MSEADVQLLAVAIARIEEKLGAHMKTQTIFEDDVKARLASMEGGGISPKQIVAFGGGFGVVVISGMAGLLKLLGLV